MAAGSGQPVRSESMARRGSRDLLPAARLSQRASTAQGARRRRSAAIVGLLVALLGVLAASSRLATEEARHSMVSQVQASTREAAQQRANYLSDAVFSTTLTLQGVSRRPTLAANLQSHELAAM